MRMDGQEESSNVEDVRGMSGGGGGFGIGGRGIGIGSVVVAVVAGWIFGINPLTLLGMMSGGGGQVAQAYVVAHEIGHHVQNQMGIMQRVDAARSRGGEAQANALSVRVELQADCFAGVWARRSQQANGWRLEPGDIEQALNAASQIGDDKLQKQARGRVVPESFTHGTSAQRVSWF